MKTRKRGLEPDQEDYEYVNRECGQLPDDPSAAECGRRYRLAQIHKLIRVYGFKDGHPRRAVRAAEA
jgi:hypothetical protein